MSDSMLQRLMQNGMAHYRAGRLAQAEVLFHEVLRAAPAHAGALQLLGLVCQQSGRLPEAYRYLRQSAAGSENAGWQVNLGLVCLAWAKPDEAIAAFSAALALDPEDPRIAGLLGVACVEARRFAQAPPHLRQALARAPHDPALHAAMGKAAQALEGPGAGLPHFQRACDLAPAEAKYPAMLGKALRDCGRTAEARAAYEQALRREPDFPARLNYALVLLQQGDWPAGWEAWDARPAVAVELPKARYQRPMWEGAPEPGSAILLRAEQGFGDVLQFIRYAPLVARRGLRIRVECHRELLRLLRTVPGVESVHLAGPRLPDCQFQQLILSLPRVFRTTRETIPATVPYVSVDAAARAAWAARLGAAAGRLRVGLAWAGRPTHPNDANRSLPPSAFAPLAAVPQVEFHQLQLGPAARQAAAAGVPLVDFTAHLTDFYDTAGLVSQLDLVISVDTALVHLAGALAKPVWTLLPCVADWRWLEGRTDSPWYPTMRLFRQPRLGDWPSVMAAVAEALREAARSARR